MSGHSRWAGIKHKKAAIDAKRGKLWTRLAREIAMAAKIGGGVVDNNPRLRKAVDDARAANMPQDTIKRAVQRGTGELPGAVYEELSFEGYGPGGAAVYCEGTTDNRNRTTQQIRRIYEDHGGNLGAAGSVAFLFERKGYITIPRGSVAEDALMELALELGAEDLKSEGDGPYEVLTEPARFEAVRDGLKAKGIPAESAEIAMLPKSTVAVAGEKAAQLLKLVDELEAHDDISHVYSNFDIPEEILAAIEK